VPIRTNMGRFRDCSSYEHPRAPSNEEDDAGAAEAEGLGLRV